MVKEECKYPLYFTLDIKQAYKANKTPLEYIKVMGEKLINLHVNDKNDKNICLLPGDGDVDFSELKKGLMAVEYKGNAIIEVYNENFITYDEIKKSKLFLMSVL